MKELREMTVKELKEMAKEMKISNWWNLKKDVLIAKIEERQNMSDEEKQAIADKRAKEDAAIKEYTKNWGKYTKRYNVLEFIEKWRSGDIVLDSEKPSEEVEEPVEEEPIEESVEEVEDVEEDQPEETSEPETKGDKNELIAKKNIKNAYNWIVGGNENSVLDGEMTQDEFDNWVTNEAFNEILNEAMNSKYEADTAGGEAPAAMKRVRKSICREYLLSLFKADNYEINVEIKEQEGHKPTPKRGALIEFDGKAQNICAWGKELGISANTLYGRIYKMGWSVERAFTTPSRKTK